MCHIKTKSNIVDSSDLCGLICGAILRQSNPFRKEQIFRIVKANSKGSQYMINDNDLKIKIEKRLDIYERNNDLQLRRDIYYPQAIESFL